MCRSKALKGRELPFQAELDEAALLSETQVLGFGDACNAL
jgi:hypothetical protein